MPHYVHLFVQFLVLLVQFDCLLQLLQNKIFFVSFLGFFITVDNNLLIELDAPCIPVLVAGRHRHVRYRCSPVPPRARHVRAMCCDHGIILNVLKFSRGAFSPILGVTGKITYKSNEIERCVRKQNILRKPNL